MDGFKNSTKTSYDTTSGRKFARGGMTVSRNDMPGGEGPMSKPAMVAKYAKGGPVKMREGGTFNERGKRATMAEIAAEDRRMSGRKAPVEGVSSRPTDSSGRRASDADLGMGQLTAAEAQMLKTAAKKPVVKGAAAGAAAGSGVMAAARAAARAAATRFGGQVTAAEMQMLKAAAAKKGVPAHSDKPMIRRKTGGLAVMPKGKC
jgi:hypothetical protein